MKKKLRTIIEELGQKANIRRELASDLERLSSRLALYHIHFEIENNVSVMDKQNHNQINIIQGNIASHLPLSILL